MSNDPSLRMTPPLPSTGHPALDLLLAEPSNEPRAVVIVHKAQTFDPSQRVPSLLLVASEEVPDLSQREPADYFLAQAGLIFDGFLDALPQGTVDQLFVLLARRAASSLVVAASDLPH